MSAEPKSREETPETGIWKLASSLFYAPPAVWITSTPIDGKKDRGAGARAVRGGISGGGIDFLRENAAGPSRQADNAKVIWRYRPRPVTEVIPGANNRTLSAKGTVRT